MIIVRLQGGMGNQMFQYAAARCLGIRYRTNIILNTDYFSNTPRSDTPRRFQLDSFSIGARVCNRWIDRMILVLIFKFFAKLLPSIREEGVQISIAELLLKLKLPAYLNGYFQSEDYFKDIRSVLINEFTIKGELCSEAKQMRKRLRVPNCVCLNIRHGDYLRKDYMELYGLCSMEYYEQALRHMRVRLTSPLICAFSDDPEWTRNNFKMDNIIFAGTDILHDYEQMYLMTICSHNILANSSFAWWGAWLNQNPNKIVIAPKTWAIKDNLINSNLVPKEWIRM